MKKKIANILKSQRGIANILVTLMVMPILLFLCFAIVPFFVFTMKLNHLNTIANHALKEAEAVGYVSSDVATNTNARLNMMGLGATTVAGISYPSYTGSTSAKVLRDAADPTIKLVLKYPAPNLTKMLFSLGRSGGTAVNEGYYYIVLYGRSETYN